MDDDILEELENFDSEDFESETTISSFRTYDEAKKVFIAKYKDFKNLDDIYC